jgi:antitoxin component YwqK of YwqJK toxin-antitoxin module
MKKNGLLILIILLMVSCGLKHKEAITYYKNGKVKERYFTLDGVKDSTYSYWDKKGQLVLTGKYIFGQKHGKWTEYITRSKNHDYTNTWYEYDKPIKAYHYASAAYDTTLKKMEKFITYEGDDTIEKEIIYRDTGIPAQIRMFKNGGLHGNMTFFYENGNIWVINKIVEGKGLSEVEFDTNGTDTLHYFVFQGGDTLSKIFYENGKRIN